MDKVYTKWDQLALHFVNLVSFLAVVGSLYYSEIAGIAPCLLCWYQRILLYPIFIITLVGIFRKDVGALLYSFVLALLAWPVALYHYLLQKTDWFADTASACSPDLPCGAEQINYLGFITIPFLALVSITLMLLVIIALYLYRRKEDQER